MVTSAKPLDGKTIVAANLAISIAQGINEHVMIVDCDLRKPSLDRSLGLNTHQGGIRDYLEKGTSVAPYLVKTPVDKLTVLPAGKAPKNPSELLSSKKMRLLVEELKTRYEDRYVIFDATPAQVAAETTFLASMVDGVILVVRAGKTPKNSILHAMENLNPNKVIGIIFNASKEVSKDYGYYYRYYQKK
jgi:exopolysaccharide/PEP-CTERM locus tyrosine autokinase